MPYRIEYSPDAVDHLRALTRREQAIVLNRVDEALKHQPRMETRNRKRMRPNLLAPWELRIGSLRVYYEVGEAPDAVVYIRAVGVKHRNQVRIGKEVIDL